MDVAHLHLMLNHVPVIGFGFGFLILLSGLFARSKEVTLVGLAMLAVAAIVAVPVYLTGEPAEEIVEKLPGFANSITEQHESAAGISLGLAIASGLCAIAAIVFARIRSSRLPSFLVLATVMLSLLAGMSMLRTANLGGQIRHTEIRADAQNSENLPGSKTDKKESGRHDDD